MSLLATIEAFFGKAETEVSTALATVEAGFKAVDNDVGAVLGQASIAGPVVMLFDPPLGAAITAGVTAITALKAELDAAFADGTAATAAVGQKVATLAGMVVTLGAQTAPFVDVLAKDVAAVDAGAVATVKAIAPIAAAA